MKNFMVIIGHFATILGIFGFFTGFDNLVEICCEVAEVCCETGSIPHPPEPSNCQLIKVKHIVSSGFLAVFIQNRQILSDVEKHDKILSPFCYQNKFGLIARKRKFNGFHYLFSYSIYIFDIDGSNRYTIKLLSEGAEKFPINQISWNGNDKFVVEIPKNKFSSSLKFNHYSVESHGQYELTIDIETNKLTNVKKFNSPPNSI